MNSVDTCPQCGGAGVTGTGLPCPACGGARAKVPRVHAPPAKPKLPDPSPSARGKAVAINLDKRTWERVCEAAKLNGREPGQWARDALMGAASQQIHKAAQRAAAG